MLERTHVLDKVKALSLLPDGLHVTTAMVAAYYEVAETAIRQLVQRHREELAANGLAVLRGSELRDFESDNLSLSKRRNLTIYSRRAVLNVGMLLRDSEVARQVRTYLLDAEYESRTHPVDNFVHSPRRDELDERIDDRITDVLGKTVVPMLNALIETAARRGTGVTGASDITARTADGRSVAVQCKNFAPFRHVLSGEMQKFLGASKVLHRADVALYVATCAFTREALAISTQGGVTAVHRGLLEAWSAGVRLQVLR
ncbi:restriction endonuclease [Streptomyces sp. NPDC005409]|uniref:restriction endonuclease n=1 Tax=Streptomyces sp. NPDC005409 TaxID=3155342 RepID=UPI0034521399